MLSRDPLGGGLRAPMSQNRYAYAMENPTMCSDPRGRCLKIARGLRVSTSVIVALAVFPDRFWGHGRAWLCG